MDRKFHNNCTLIPSGYFAELADNRKKCSAIIGQTAKLCTVAAFCGQKSASTAVLVSKFEFRAQQN